MKKVNEYLKPTDIIDCDDVVIQEKAKQVTMGQEKVVKRARSLFHFVRDEIKYNPFLPRSLPEHFRACDTLVRGGGLPQRP